MTADTEARLTEAQIDTLERNYLAGLISEQEYDDALGQILREEAGRAALARKED